MNVQAAVVCWSVGRGHLHHVSAAVVVHGVGIAGLGPQARESIERIALEVVGVSWAFVGFIWLGNQAWARRRSYVARDVSRAWEVGAYSSSLMQTMFTTRLTGPDTARYPANDLRGDVIRFVTPWPVMLTLSIGPRRWNELALLR